MSNTYYYDKTSDKDSLIGSTAYQFSFDDWRVPQGVNQVRVDRISFYHTFYNITNSNNKIIISSFSSASPIIVYKTLKVGNYSVTELVEEVNRKLEVAIGWLDVNDVTQTIDDTYKIFYDPLTGVARIEASTIPITLNENLTFKSEASNQLWKLLGQVDKKLINSGQTVNLDNMVSLSIPHIELHCPQLSKNSNFMGKPTLITKLHLEEGSFGEYISQYVGKVFRVHPTSRETLNFELRDNSGNKVEEINVDKRIHPFSIEMTLTEKIENKILI